MNITTEERTKRFAVVERIEEAVEAMRLAGCNAVARAEEEHKKELADAKARAVADLRAESKSRCDMHESIVADLRAQLAQANEHSAKLSKWANAYLTQLRNDGIDFDDQREIEALLKSNTP